MDYSLVVDLLSRGFFPDALPPCFSAKKAGALIGGMSATLKPLRFEKRKPAKPAICSGTKSTGGRRSFSTPTPLSHFFVANFLEERWTLIDDFVRKSSISASRPNFASATSNRAISVTPFGELGRIAFERVGHAPFVVRTDISQFYPSIYTHSLPWAYHGKTVSKQDRKPASAAMFFNELDFHLQYQQDGQTRGILVGPDSSRIVSEIVLAAIDDRISKALDGKIIGALRHVDDFYVGVDSEQAAAFALSEISSALHEYELLPNDFKTKIISTATPMDDVWPIQLRRLCDDILSDESANDDDISGLFEVTLNYCVNAKSQSPIKLLLKKIDEHGAWQEDLFDAFENYLLRFVHHYPHAIDYVCMIAGARAVRGLGIAAEGWHEVLSKSIGRYARVRQHQEVAWLTWLALVANIPVTDEAVREVAESRNSHLNAMLFAANKEHLLPKLPEIELAPELSLRGSDWIAVHEGLLAGKVGRLDDDDFAVHAELLKQGVSFIDFSSAKKRLEEADEIIANLKFGYDDAAQIGVGFLTGRAIEPGAMDEFVDSADK